MLIKTISFDIHDFNNNTTELFLILDTIANQEFVFTHRYTRNIQFGKTFDFQLKNDMRLPVEMISDSVWLALLPEMEKEMAEFDAEKEADSFGTPQLMCQCENVNCTHTDVEFKMCESNAELLSSVWPGTICSDCAKQYSGIAFRKIEKGN